ncbi:unnamed protein product [Schistosoma margrebowiei]|uniref:Uncharacterized protein n=1 Tax=Schistosoma margrebowiei TaxID=48269 RepID=A0A183LM36_9TREM|nr:unnamed protein product [Schistosoma margrebowiei]
MRKYDLEVHETSEKQRTEVRQLRLNSRELLLHSEHEKENPPHTQGVELMLFKRAQNAYIGLESHGPRTIKACFKTTTESISMNIIECYAPTNDYNEDAEDKFYDWLQ